MLNTCPWCFILAFVALRQVVALCLTCATADGVPYNVVDVYNVATGAWSTAQLSVGRYGLAATSVGNVAFFAGGLISAGALLCKNGCVRC